MQQSKLSLEQVIKGLSNAVSTVLGFAIVRPKTTALASVAIIGLVTVLCVAPKFHSNKPPPPNARRIQEMTNAVERADERIRNRTSFAVRPDPELQGVFQTIRDQPLPSEASP